MTRPTRHQTMMEIAQAISKRSTCARRRVGCVLTDVNGRVLSMGHNGVPRGHAHCTEHPCGGQGFKTGQGLEACQAIHAEQNALMFCSDIEKIHACYVTTSPCEHCSKMLLNTGLKLVVYQAWYTSTPSWLFDDAGIKLLHLDDAHLLEKNS